MHKPRSLFQDIAHVLGGNVAAQGFSFITLVLISRFLGVTSFGTFSVLISVYTVATQLTDMGISTSYVKVASEISEQKDRYRNYFFTTLAIKTALTVMIAAAFALTSREVLMILFGSDSFNSVFRIMVWSLIPNTVLTQLLAHYQAVQKFKTYVAVNTLSKSLRFFGVLGVIFFTSASLQWFIYAYAYAAATVPIVYAAWYCRPSLILRLRLDYSLWKRSSSLSTWVFLSSISVILMMRLDVMMVQRLGDATEAGYFSAATQLAQVMPLITTSVTTTLLPKIQSIVDGTSVRWFFRSTLRYAKHVLTLLVVTELLAPILIRLIFGIHYIHSIGTFRVLISAFIVGILINPLSLVFYSLNKAYLLTIMNWTQLAINVALNFGFIPQYGAIGAAFSATSVRMFSGLYVIWFIYRESKKSDGTRISCT